MSAAGETYRLYEVTVTVEPMAVLVQALSADEAAEKAKADLIAKSPNSDVTLQVREVQTL